MKEKHIQTMLSKVHDINGVFELKLCKTKSIRFDSVKDHQVEALLSSMGRGLFYKIPDFPMFAGSKTRFNAKKPFDFFYLKNTPAYVVICFYVPRRRKTCYYIRVEAWVNARNESKKKSIRENEVYLISEYKKEL